MGDFEEIEAGFNREDETINFGSRFIVDDSLYEISTLACFKSSDCVNSQVKINALMKSNRIILSTNRSIKIFEEEDVANLLFNLSFESEIQNICVSTNCDYLLVCLENGTVNIFEVESSSCLFSRCISTEIENNGFVRCFNEETNTQSFVIVHSSGKVYRLLVKSVIKAEDDSNESPVTVGEILNLNSKISLAAFTPPLLIINSNGISVVNLQTKVILSCGLSGSPKFKSLLHFGHKFLGLDSDGNIFRICPTTLTIFPIFYQYLLEDLVVTNDCHRMQIVVFTKKNEGGDSFLQLLRQDFVQIFSLNVSNTVIPIQREKITDDVLFLSRITSNELRLQKVYETDPELRLKRLLSRQRFDEAEQFAKTFKLDPVLILKAKAQLLVDKTECDSEDIVNLMTILDSIDDNCFKIQCCSNVDCGNLADVRKILVYGVNISPKNNDCKDLKKVLSDMLFRFDTFMALSMKEDVQSWCRFLSADLVAEVKSFLENYQINDAIIVYNRLDKKTISHSLTSENIEEILRILNSLPTNVVQPFFSTFIPITMANKPSCLAIFVKWLHNKIFQLEKRDQINFPENAIKLGEFMLKLLRVDKSGCISFQRHQRISKEALNNLCRLMEGLKTLHMLKKDFRINVHLEEYLQEPKVLIKTLMNVVMTPEDYDYFLREFLYIYMLQNQFDIDAILSEEIQVLIKYDDSRMHIVEIILKYISSVQRKLEVVLDILENAQVPWNDVVKKIGRESLQYSHPLTEDIRTKLIDESRIMVLRNRKYNIREKQITTLSDLQFIIEHIVYVNEPSMEEDVHRLCKNSRDRQEALQILTRNFIVNGEIDKAMLLLDKTSTGEVYQCLVFLFRLIKDVINDKWDPEFTENCYQALYPIFRRLQANCDNEIWKMYDKKQYAAIRATYVIDKTFGKQIVTSDLHNKHSKDKVFEELVQVTADMLSEDNAEIVEILTKCDTLALCFLEEKDFVLIKVCEKIGKFDLIIQAAEHLYKSTDDSKKLCLIAAVFMKYLASTDLQVNGNNFSDNSIDVLNSADISQIKEEHSELDLYLKGLKCVQDIIRKALVNATKDNICDVYEVAMWVNCCSFVTKLDSVLHGELFTHTFPSSSCSPTYNTLSSIREVFLMFVGFSAKLQTKDTYCLTYFSADIPKLTEEHLLQQISSLPEYIESLCREGQHLTAFQLVKTLRMSLSVLPLSDGKIIKLLDSTITYKCLPLLIQAVIASKYIDATLLFNLLLATGAHYFKCLNVHMKMYRRQPRKLRDLADIGIKLLDLYESDIGRGLMVTTALTCKWWQKLKIVEGKVQYETFFKSSPVSRLMMLIGQDCLTVDLIEEYCTDFNLAVESYYMEYLRNCLLNWKPDYECKTDLDGKRKVIVNKDNSLVQKVEAITNRIEQKSDVTNILEEVLIKANYYYYEVFICVFQILGTKHMDIRLLFFLMEYQRFSQPSQREKEEWYTGFPDSQILDPLSEFRLPFTRLLFTSDIWNIIRPEINLKSYKCWFEAVNILSKNLKRDDICVYAVKQVVSSGILDNNLSQDWMLYPKYEDLLLEVDECVQHIVDSERATSVIYHLMYHTPNGADKVNAARLSFKYASKYQNNFPDSPDVEKAFIKVKNKYYGFSATHILYKYNLAENKYLQLVINPESLIEGLYMDERIIKQWESMNLSCPDINMAVDAIAQVFGLQLEKIRYNLLNSWLNNSDMDVDFDSTMVFPTNPVKVSGKSDENDHNLRRAIYVCNSGKKEFWETYLLRQGLGEDDVSEPEQTNTSFKARALKCFCAITNEETVVNMTKLTYTEFLNYVDKLTLLSELESLGVTLNIQLLDQSNKKKLLKRLLQMGKPLAIKAMGEICMTYSMEENRYWDFIVNQSIKFEMVDELKIYVDFLRDKCDQGYYLKAWQVIIDSSFQQINPSSPEELEEVYVNNLLMAQSSPVLFSLDFEKIVKLCLQSQKIEFAAVLLRYLSEEKKNAYFKDIVKKKNLLLNLDKLAEKGIWGVENVKQMFE